MRKLLKRRINRNLFQIFIFPTRFMAGKSSEVELNNRYFPVHSQSNFYSFKLEFPEGFCSSVLLTFEASQVVA